MVFLRGWFRFRATGTVHVPAEGPAIVAPNHKNFLDAFFIGLALHRHVRFIGQGGVVQGTAGLAVEPPRGVPRPPR